MKLPTQEIVAFTGVFLWASFWLNGGRLWKGHGAHQAVHSSAADGNAIVTGYAEGWNVSDISRELESKGYQSIRGRFSRRVVTTVLDSDF